MPFLTFQGGTCERRYLRPDYAINRPDLDINAHSDWFMTKWGRPYFVMHFDAMPELSFAFPERSNVEHAGHRCFSIPVRFNPHNTKTTPGIDFGHVMILRDVDAVFDPADLPRSEDLRNYFKQNAQKIADIALKYVKDYQDFMNNKEGCRLSPDNYFKHYKFTSYEHFAEELEVPQVKHQVMLPVRYYNPVADRSYYPSILYIPEQNRIVSSFSKKQMTLESFIEFVGKKFPAGSHRTSSALRNAIVQELPKLKELHKAIPVCSKGEAKT